MHIAVPAVEVDHQRVPISLGVLAVDNFYKFCMLALASFPKKKIFYVLKSLVILSICVNKIKILIH